MQWVGYMLELLLQGSGILLAIIHMVLAILIWDRVRSTPVLDWYEQHLDALSVEATLFESSDGVQTMSHQSRWQQLKSYVRWTIKVQ